MVSQTDPEPLLKRLRNKDPDTVAEIYRYMQRYLAPLGKGHNISQEDLEDIMHDALILFLQKIQAPEFRLYSDVKVFVYGIARHLMLNQQRKNRRRQSVSLNEEIQQSENIALDEADETQIIQWIDARNCQELVQAELDRLSNDEIRILRLYYFEKMKMKDIAAQLGISSGHATQRSLDALRSLEEELIPIRYLPIVSVWCELNWIPMRNNCII